MIDYKHQDDIISLDLEIVYTRFKSQILVEDILSTLRNWSAIVQIFGSIDHLVPMQLQLLDLMAKTLLIFVIGSIPQKHTERLTSTFLYL